MGSFAANNVTTWFSAYDMTSDLNSTSLAMQYDALDTTVYGCTARTRAAGLEDVTLQEAGFWQAGAGTIDPTAFTALGGASQVITNSVDGLETSVAYFYRARQFQYQTFGAVGEMMPFSLAASSSRGTGLAAVGAVRGRVLKQRAPSVSGTGATGTAFQLGATSATQFLYAAFHVFSVGTTITAVLESNADNTFGSPTTRMTFGPITTTGGTWGTRVAGAITDQWYRLRVTAITGTFSIACVAGIK
jgi:hypothetical protein